jgi:hypothetical protein
VVFQGIPDQHYVSEIMNNSVRGLGGVEPKLAFNPTVQ